MASTTYKTTRTTTVERNNVSAPRARRATKPVAKLEILNDGPNVLVDGVMPIKLARMLQRIVESY